MNPNKFTNKAQEGVVSAIIKKIIPQSQSGQEPQKHLQRQIESDLAKRPKISGGSFYLSPSVNKIFSLSEKEAKNLKDEFVSTEHILLGIVEEASSAAAALLVKSGVTKDKILQSLVEIRGSHRITDQNPEDKYQALEKYSRDLTDLARKGKLDPVIGRDEEIRRTVQVLSRRTKNNPVLIGDPGVGKTAIVEGLAQRIVSGNVPETLRGKRVVSLDMALLVAGTSHRGQFEERLKKVIEEVIKAQGQIIIFMDEIHTVVGAGAAEGAIDAANMLKPSLARGELQLVGATTLDEYRKRVEKDAALERRFQPVLVNEP